MEEIAYVILQLFLLLVFAKIMGSIFERFSMPKLIGEILAGIIFINVVIFSTDVLNSSFFEDVLGFTVAGFEVDAHFLHVMGELGIIFLLFAVGLETKFGDMMKVGKASAYIAILCLVIPFAGGMLFLFHESIGFHAAVLLGAALFGTSTAVGVECLRNMDAMGTKEAKLIVSTTIIDDILCLTLLGVIVSTTGGASSTLMTIINITVVAAFILFMFLFVSKVKKLAQRRKERIHRRAKKETQLDDPIGESAKSMSEFSALGLAVLVCLGLAAFSMTIGLAAIVGAFLAGMLFAEFKDTVPVEHNFNVIIYFMLPFFFIWVGMKVHLNAITMSILILLALVVVVAIVTKYVAAYFGALKFAKLSKESSRLVAYSMIPRGEVGIIVATLGLSSGVFGDDLFAVIILMALITSIMVPPLMTRAYRAVQKNQAEAFEEAFKEHDGAA